MPKLKFAFYTLVASILATPVIAEPVEFVFDHSHANISFNYNHLGFSQTDGRFKNWTGTLFIDEETPANSSVSVNIDMNSITTFAADRDAHLKSPDFFDVAQFPNATFKSEKVVKTSENTLQVTGPLTIHGISKPTTLEVLVRKIADHPMAKKKAAGFSVTTTINRSNFGVGAYTPYVGDEVKIVIETETLVK
ncbi:YceI family protein [Polycladidibacter stylochi]|uniref:YceI family protein n=1 Tax=Polycladidibacter stylochi TaxID=1807766 RepID=UPI00082BEC9A|nr:YceI family protein [Pseudovibrio stylochi]